jgi:hypothetical protein
MNPEFHKRKTELTEDGTSICLLQTENRNDKFPLVCWEMGKENGNLFSLVSKSTIAVSANVPIYASTPLIGSHFITK